MLPKGCPVQGAAAREVSHGGWVRDGFVAGRRDAVVRLGIDEMAEDGLRRGEDGRVGGFSGLEGDLHPVFAAVCPVDLGALFGS
jgi:hypothetical protein